MALEKLGPYKVHHIIGRGGMGSVYSAEHEETGEKVAVKVLSLVHSEDYSFRERFTTEIESLKKLRHDNIVRLIGYGEHDGHLFYAMDLMDEASLQNRLSGGQRYTWREVADIGVQICRALKHAHDRGVIHRDIKPANLLVDDEGRICLSDFGIAKLFGGTQLTADGGVVGTADYMAPEQSAGLPTTPRTDMFSLGCVLYALLAGRPPFAAPTVAEAIHRLRYEEAPLLSRRVADVPDEFERIIMQLLEKEPSQRIATPLALSNRLQAMLHALSEDDEKTSTSVGPTEDGRGSTEDIPTMASVGPTPVLNTASRSTVIVPEDMSLSDVIGENAQSQSMEFETGDTSAEKARENRFITAEDARREEALAEADQDYSVWIKLTAVLVLIGGVVGGIYLFARPTSEAALFDRISVAVEKEDIAALADVQDDIDEYVKRFPGTDRASEVAQYRDEVELYRMRKRFERRVKRPGSGESLSLVERLYLEALRLSEQDPQQAMVRFRALVDVFEDDGASRTVRQCVQLAKAQATRLQAVAKKNRDKMISELTARIDEARAAMSHDRHRATRICRGLIQLGAGKPWAAEIVAAAQNILSELDE